MGPDLEKLEKEIVDRFEGMIQAHWDKDVDYLLEDIGEGFFSISEAEITYPTLKEQRQKFTDYLNNTTFTEYSSLMKPEIGFSDDASMAWGSFKVKVKGETSNRDRSKTGLDFVCAWLWLFKWVDNRWMRIGEVFTWK
jgi:hypothetical protein